MTETADCADDDGGSLGQRLRAGRESRGWSVEEVASRLKLPGRLIGRLEADDYAGLTQGVYLRGYLISYANLVGAPKILAERVAANHLETAPLVATGTISRSRYLIDRYSVSATYLVLTGLIVAPAVWLATHGGIEQNLARTAPLDSAASLVVEMPASVGADRFGGEEIGLPPVATAMVQAPSPVAEEPLIASMAPFTSAPVRAQPIPPPAPVVPAEDGHTLSLQLSETSWVEVVTADGRKLEYSLLPAGSSHEYRSEQPLTVRIGNTQDAKVRVDGQLVDIAPFQRANVARFRVFADGAGISRVDF